MKYYLFRKKISICGSDLMIYLAALANVCDIIILPNPTRTYLHASHICRQGLDSASKKKSLSRGNHDEENTSTYAIWFTLSVFSLPPLY